MQKAIIISTTSSNQKLLSYDQLENNVPGKELKYLGRQTQYWSLSTRVLIVRYP